MLHPSQSPRSDLTELSQRRAAILKITKGIDSINETLAPILGILVLPLIGANVIEVMLRYGFDSPTTWATDVTVMSYGSMFMLGSAYALLKGAHVRTDMLWEKFSDRKKGTIDAICYIVLFMPAMIILLGISIDDVAYAFSIGEKSTIGLWQPLTWPFRAVIPLSAGLLLIQGISETIKALWASRTGEMLVHNEKIEI